MNRAAHRPAARSGMVLLEVVIALTLFAVVSLGLITALNQTMDTAGDRHALITAQRGLENQLVLLHNAPLAPGERDVSDNAAGLLYHISVAPEPMQDQFHRPILGLIRATVTAHWKQGNRAESRDVSQLFYQP